MNEKELDFILQEGEGFKIEFKESISGIDKDMQIIKFVGPAKTGFYCLDDTENDTENSGSKNENK